MTTHEPHTPPVENIPLSERTFTKRPAAKDLLVIQYVTEGGTGRTYFRFIGPKGTQEGFASTAEEAAERATEVAQKLGLEIHDTIVQVTI